MANDLTALPGGAAKGRQALYVDPVNGDDVNTGHSPAEAFRTIKQGLKMISFDGGDLVLAPGVYYEGIKGSNLFPKKYPIRIHGEGHAIIWGYDGQFFPEDNHFLWVDPNGQAIEGDFNPAAPPPHNWQNITVRDCHDFELLGVKALGGAMQTVEVNDSNPEYGVRRVKFIDCDFRYGSSRGFFMGGNNIEDVEVLRCRTSQVCYGDTTHAMYFSGGAWTGEFPPIRNIRVKGSVAEFAGGRHCLQFNGRFEGVELAGNLFRHGQLAGISLIGVQEAVVRHNQIYGNNRQGIVIYDDDWSIDFSNPDKVAWFLSCHHPNSDILVERNSIVVGPYTWMKDPWHNEDPSNRAAIEVNNIVHGKGLITNYLNKNLVFRDNVIASPNNCPIRFAHLHETGTAFITGNVFRGTVQETGISIGSTFYPLQNVEKHFPEQVFKNIADPELEFHRFPEYGECVDKSVTPLYNFGDFPTAGDLRTKKWNALGKGAQVRPRILTESTASTPE